MKRCCKQNKDGTLSCKDSMRPAESDKPKKPTVKPNNPKLLDQAEDAVKPTKAETLTKKATCPPEGWDRCSGTWPPPADGYCCSSSNYLGISEWHCKHNNGINALDSCCKMKKNGTLSCKGEGEAAYEEGEYEPEEADAS